MDSKIPSFVFALVMMIFAICIFLSGSDRAESAGYELVKVTNVQNVFDTICTPAGTIASVTSTEIPKQSPIGSVQRLVKPVDNCQQVLRYKVTFKRKNGTSGNVITVNRPFAPDLVLRFCPGPQGQPEVPCPQ